MVVFIVFNISIIYLFPILILLGKIVLNANFGFEISNLLLLMLGVLLLIIVFIPFIISFIIRTASGSDKNLKKLC